MKKIFTFCVSLLAALSVFAYDFQSGDLFYNITSSSAPYTVEVTQQSQYYNSNYSGVDTIVIPETVTYNAIIYSVTSIGESAFDHSKLTIITIPNTVTSIGEYAFAYCQKLTSVAIGSGVKTIHMAAFNNCSALRTITIPANVKEIYNQAFTGASISTIYMEGTTPPSLLQSKSDGSAFMIFSTSPTCYVPCSAVASYKASTKWKGVVREFVAEFPYTFTIASANTSLGTIAITQQPDCSTAASFEAIPNTGCYFTQWSDGNTDNPRTLKVTQDTRLTASFASSTYVVNLIAGANGAVSGAGTYDHGTTATITAIPNDGYHFTQWSDGNTDNPRSIVVVEPISLTALFEENYTQEHCQIIYTSTDGDVVTPWVTYNFGADIISNTYADGQGVITFDGPVTAIGDTAFANCSSLESIIIPDRVTVIGDQAFQYCTYLKDVTIGNRVESIGTAAFNNCSSLRSIIIPQSVKYIYNYAFVGASLNSIYVNRTIPPTLNPEREDPYMVLGTGMVDVCYIPCGKLASYQASEWKTKGQVREFVERPSYLLTVQSVDKTMGTATITQDIDCETQIATIAATPYDGYRFVQWSDGNTDNPRSWVVTEDTYLEAIFEKSIDPTWQITYTSANRKIVTPYKTDVFGANIVSNTYENGIGTITFDGPVTSIGKDAFAYRNSLTSITIPGGVTNIRADALALCSSLTSIVVANGNTTYDSRENSNAIIETATNTLIAGCRNTIIPNNVTSIGDSAFISRSKLSSITIPDGVISIGNHAFAGCSSLVSITISNTVTSIGDFAFSHCSSLASITIPNSVINIGENAFTYTEIYDDDANWLDNVLYIDNCLIEAKGLAGAYAILENTRVIAEMACYSLDDLTSITIPNSVTSIGDHAFMHTPIRTVIIPRSLTNIGRVVFTELDTIIVEKGNSRYDSRDNCNAIIETATNTLIAGCEKTIIPNSVTRIGEWAFAFYSLHNLVIPNSITSIGDYAFWGCYYSNHDNNNNIVIPSSVTHIGDSAFRWLSDNYTHHIYVKSPTPPTIGKEAFASSSKCYIPCNSSTAYQRSDWNTYFSEFVEVGCDPNSQITYTSTDGCIVRPYAYNVFGANIVSNTYENGVGTITFDAPITTIGDYAFAYQSSLTSITIPNSVTSIGKDAFLECESLTSVTIDNSVTSIGDGAFYACSSLDTIHVEATTPPALGSDVFEGTPSPVCIIPCGTLAAYQASDWASQVGEFLEEGCIDPTWQITYTSSNDSIVTPYATDVFGANIVSNIYENGVGTITFDGPVTSIGYQAFRWCESLTSITIPNNVTSIGDDAFYFCSSLTSIVVEEGNTIYDSRNNCNAIIETATNSLIAGFQNTIIPNSVTSIGDYAFHGCDGLTSITIPNSVTSIGDYAFYFCRFLTSITIPNSVTRIGEKAFDNCDLTSITIPNSVTSIGENAFGGDLTSINVESGNAIYDSRENCNAIIETASNTLIAGCQNTVIPNSVTNIGDYAFWGRSDLTSIIIPNSVSSIGYHTFGSCHSLTSITIPNSVTKIGACAFIYCYLLNSITIPSSVKSIGYGAFSHCSSLDTIHVEATTPPTLGIHIFEETPSPVCVIPCGTLAAYQSSAWASQVGSFVEDCVEGQQIYYTSTDGNIVIPNKTDVFGVNIVGNTYENGVGTITFDGPITSIGDHAFLRCDKLSSITIPNSVTSIGVRTFKECISLTSISLSDSLKNIGTRAFWECSSLSSITIPKYVVNIGDDVFGDCSSLIQIIVEDGNERYDSRNDCNAIIETATNVLKTGCQNTIIPNDILTIGRYAFCGCHLLDAISIPNSVINIEQRAFIDCPNLLSLTIPNSVTTIGSYAFGDCSSLASITIPDGVTSIGDLAFYNCTSLTSITCEATTPPTLGSEVFPSELTTAYISCGTKEAYEASDWAQYVSEFIAEGCISFELNGGVVSAELPIYIASSYTLPTPTREGYIFRGWYDNPQGIGNRLSTLPAGYEGTIYAYWTKEPTDALNPFAYALSSELSQDNSQLLINYSLNARAMDVQIVIMDGETAVKAIACDGLSKGSHSIAIPTAGLPEHKQLTWKVEVKGAEVTEPTEYAVNYGFYHPSAVDINNNPENPTFGMILTNEGMQKVKDVEGYLSTGYGAGIYAFNPAFEPMPNGSNPGYNGGIEFTDKRADAPDSITNGYTAYSPRRIRISEDGRIFVTSLNTDGNYLWEVNPENMNEWNSIFKGTLNGDKELVDAGGNFIAAPNTGFDVKGSGEDLQLMMYSANLLSITSAAMSGFRCDEYNLGTATSWATAPSKNWVLGKYAINYTGTQVEYDNEGGIWIASSRGTASDATPGLVHINKDGVEDAKLVWSMLRNAGIRFNHDFTKLVIAGVNGGSTSTPKKATIYAVSKDSNGAPVLTEETVIDMAILGHNLNDFAWDYAGNLYGVSNSGEKIVAWAMPRSADEIVTTPAASKYNFTYSDDAITYELNGGVTNDYGWMSKDDMYHELLVDINAIIPTSRVDVDTVTLAYDKTKNISEGIPTYWLDESLNVLLTNSDFLSKWGWLIDYIEGACASESKWLPSTSARYLRFNLSAFFFEKEYTSWPQTPDYSKYGLYYNFQTAWKHAYTNPTNPTEEFILNTPYKEGYTFAGWYTNADLSGEKITIVEAETNDTLYAKWIENSLVESTWKVLYTSTNGGIVAPNAIDVFGANIISNTYENGVGTITFDGPVTSIGGSAFAHCSSLTSFIIPNSVTKIGPSAFHQCSSLTSISIPNSVTSIGMRAFIGCSSLISMVVEQGNIIYDSRNNCNAIVETATNTLVAGCQKTIIPNSIVTIGDWAFQYCSSLTSITIPESVTIIGKLAFYSCSSLTSITIPNSIMSIARATFYGCSSLDTIHVEATTPPALEDSTVFMNTPAPVCVIPCGTLAAYEASNWASQVGGFVEDCVEGQQIYYTSTDGNIVTPYKTNVFGANIVSNTYENGVGTITFDGPVTSIGGSAFYDCFGLTSITIPNSVTSIANSAFCNCLGLTSINIPNSVTSIGNYAFNNCLGLTSVTIPNSVTSIGGRAFEGCSRLTSITIPNSVTSIGVMAFASCSGLTSIVVDGGNTTYDSRENCNAIIETATNTLITGCQNTIIPNSVTSIGEWAFYGCERLTSITIPNSVTSIGERAFWGCSGLTFITIPNSVTSIGSRAFNDCSGLTSIVVDGGNTTYDSRENCNAIIETATNTLITGCQNTIIPNSVMSIGEWAFGYCTSLTSITVPNSVTSIGDNAFYYCRFLTSITLPNSVTSIGNRAFADCSSLDTIHLEATTPPALEDSTVFMNTPASLCVIPCGTLAAYEASDWASEVGEFVEEGCAPIQMCGDDLYWEYADGVLTITGTGDMYDYAKDTDVPWYDVRGNIKTVSLPNAMTKIGQNAFYKCTAMTTINMPTSLTAIGEKAFAQDTKLACEIILPASMTNIATRAFFNCQAVTAFHIEATTPPTIPNDAFERTTAPIHVPCGYGHVYGKHTQWGVLNLEMCELLQDNVYYSPIDGHTARAVTYHSNPTDTIVIPSAVVIDGMPRIVTEVADFAFTDCKDIPAIIFNEGLEYIGERAFVRCYGLQGTIVLPATLETIGERAFSYCDNVEKYLIQAMTPPALGDGVFTCANHDALFYVSCEVMDDYKVAARWSSLKSRLRDACLNIYHYNTPLGTNGVYTTEDTLVASIYYRRKFTPYRWETLYLPFEVDRVTVLENGLEYDLTAWDIVDGGHYFLAKPDGMLNKEILFGFTDELESHTPYIIQFSDAYYTDKLITFYGKESWNKLSTSFEVLSSSAWMQIAGNTTLQDQLLEKPVYMLRSGLDFILQKTTTTLHPFECYVMPYTAQSGAPARMNVRLRDDVATAVESVKGNESHLTYTVDGYTLTVYPQGQAFSIYSLNGALIYSCEAGKEAVDCELNSGCYLLHAGTEAHKIML